MERFVSFHGIGERITCGIVGISVSRKECQALTHACGKSHVHNPARCLPGRQGRGPGGAGRVSDDVKIAVKDGFDFIELDGMQGSTGAGSAEVIDYVGVPTLPAIIEAIDALEDIGRRQDIELVVMGGIRDGVDAVKALCLGADAVAFGTSAIIAGGCIACMQCHVGQCVTGIATQDPEHEKRYDPEAESHNIHRFLEGVRWQIAALTHALGYSDFRALNRDDLVALTPEAAEITGLPYEPGARAKVPELRVELD